MLMKQYKGLSDSSNKRTTKTDIKEIFKDFERVAKSSLPAQQKIDKLNLEMLRILRGRVN
jgi:hypothetical protein